jgi:hypothetical protein
MQWLAELDGVPSVAGQVDVILEIMRDDEANNDFSMVFDKLEDRIRKHIDAGSQREAMRLITTIQSHIGTMPDGHWKTRYQNEIKRKYGTMISGAEKARLGGVE